MAEKSRNVTTHRLLIGFSSIILLLIVFGVISLIEIRTLSKVTRTIYKHPLVVSNASLRATVSMIKMHRSMKDVVLFDVPSEINIAISTVNEQGRMVFGSLDTVKKNILGDEGKKLENETRHLFTNWKPIREEVIKLVRENQRKEAAKITMEKGATYVAKLENKMLELTSYARNKATDFVLHGENVYYRVMKTTIIFISIVLLLSVFIAFFTIRRTQTAEERLRESEQQYRALFDNNHTAILLIDPETGHIVDANPAACSYYGHSKQTLTSMMITDINTLSQKEVFEELQRAKSEKRKKFNFRHRLANGSVCDVEIYSGPITVHGKTLLCSIIHDISERKHAEEALRKSEEKFRSLAENSQDYIMRYDEQCRHLYQNAAAFKVSGVPEEEFIGRTHRELGFDEDLCDLWEEKITGTFKSGQPTSKIFEWESVEGTVFLDWRLYPEFDQDGKVMTVLGVSRDITENKRIEKEREKLINELQGALKEIKTLRGILPLCSFCKKIRDDEGYWEQVDVYIHKYSQADISHSICPDCAEKHYPDLDIYE